MGLLERRTASAQASGLPVHKGSLSSPGLLRTAAAAQTETAAILISPADVGGKTASPWGTEEWQTIEREGIFNRQLFITNRRSLFVNYKPSIINCR